MNQKFRIFNCVARPLKASNCYCKMCYEDWHEGRNNPMKRGSTVLEIEIDTASGRSKTFLCKKHASEFSQMVTDAMKGFEQ